MQNGIEVHHAQGFQLVVYDTDKGTLFVGKDFDENACHLELIDSQGNGPSHTVLEVPAILMRGPEVDALSSWAKHLNTELTLRTDQE